MTVKPGGKANTLAALIRLAIYAAMVLSPFIVKGLSEVEELDEAFSLRGAVIGLSLETALLGFAIMAMQPVLAARLKWVERPFGLDRVMRFHKWMGVTAGILILSHPLLLAAGSGHWGLVTSFSMSWPVMLGKVALIILLVMVIASVYRTALGIEFQLWRTVHDVAAVAITGFVLVHAARIGKDLEEVRGMRTLFIGLAFLALFGLVYVRFLSPSAARRLAYSVADVRPETHNVWTVEMTPPAGTARYDFLPGQFHFLTIYREGRRAEEHPFTISSSPTLAGRIASTIKASGDYTSTIGSTLAGDRAALEGPFGRFSYVLHPGEKDLVFVAGGIGVTPLMSMLRHMRDTGWDGSVTLLYASRAESDIVFRQEIADMEASSSPRLKVVHVLSEAGNDWRGERGRVDEASIRKYVGDVAGKSFYLCGPPPMMNGLRATLRAMAVPRQRVRWEFFSL